MKRAVVRTPHFLRMVKKLATKKKRLLAKLEATVELLEKDAFQGSLCTHKLRGELAGIYACSVDYDFRLLFKIAVEHKTEVIVLLDLGTHDEVY